MEAPTLKYSRNIVLFRTFTLPVRVSIAELSEVICNV